MKVFSPSSPRNAPQAAAGFSLLELVIGMAIVAVISTFSFRFVAGSMEAYADAEQRFSLIEKVDPAISRLAGELSQALPYSVRIMPAGNAIEFALVVDGGYYRTREPAVQPNPPLMPLQFNAIMPGGAGNEFTLMGGIKTIDSDRVSDPNPTFGDFYDLLGPDYAVSVGHFGDIGADGRPLPGFNIYAPPTVRNIGGVAANVHVVSPPGVTLQSPDNQNTFVTLPADHVFPQQSPARRLNVVNGFVSYICTNNRLYRRRKMLADRTIDQDASVDDAAILVSGVSSCLFSQVSGNLDAGPLASVTLRLNHPNDDGSLVVFRQVRIKAAP